MKRQRAPHTQAGRIIAICGVQRIADWTGVSTVSVYRWNHPKERGGADGLIPTRHHKQILQGAAAAGIRLHQQDFFPATGLSARAA